MSRFAVLALVLAMVVPSCETAARSSGGTAYLTILFGRTLWQPVVDCQPVEGGVTLERVARELQARGRAATGSVVTGRTHDDTRQCEFTVMSYASWADLAHLRDGFGWTFVSNGATHGDMTRMAHGAQVDESCGSLEQLEARGHLRAWGLFGYGNDKRDDAVQRTVVDRCFAFGRRYSKKVNHRRDLSPPWFANALSVEGGMSVDRMAKAMAPKPGEWRVVQVYRLVEGERRTGKQQWDCRRSSDRHWTTRTELYCLDDFLAAVDRIPAGVVVTDPATVAEAWGRANPRAHGS